MADEYLTPAQTAELIPGMTTAALAQLRSRGGGPPYRQPTTKTILYKESEVIAWVESSTRTQVQPKAE